MKPYLLSILSPMALLFPAILNAGPHQLPGRQDIDQLISASDLVIKGVVKEVRRRDGKPEVVLLDVKKIYKGAEPGSATVEVYIKSASDLCAIPEVGSSMLAFAKTEAGKVIASDCPRDIWAAPRKQGSKNASQSPAAALESDLRAALKEPDRKDVIAAIRQLGNLKAKSAREEIKPLLKSDDPDIQAMAVRSLLKLGDYSGLSRVAWLQGKKFDEWLILAEINSSISSLDDKQAVPALIPLTKSPNDAVVRSALDALRNIKSPEATQSLIELLDHGNPDIRFSALMTLTDIEPKVMEDAPGRDLYMASPDKYAKVWKEWWTNKKKGRK